MLPSPEAAAATSDTSRSPDASVRRTRPLAPASTAATRPASSSRVATTVTRGQPLRWIARMDRTACSSTASTTTTATSAWSSSSSVATRTSGRWRSCAAMPAWEIGSCAYTYTRVGLLLTGGLLVASGSGPAGGSLDDRPLPSLHQDSTGSSGCPNVLPSGRSGGQGAGRRLGAMSATMTLAESQLAVEPGGSTTTELRLRNTGVVVDQFTVEVLGEVAAWATVQPPTVSLLPGQETSLNLILSPPRSEGLRAGAWPFAVRVTSSEDPERPVVHEALVEVAPFTETVAELMPRTSRGRFGATHSVAFDNRGNTAVRARLAASDEGDQLRFGLRPDTLVAAPGTAEFAQVRVRPRKLLWRGQPRTAPFQIAVRHDGAEDPILLPGTILQEPVIARWLPRALLALLAGVAALALLWQLLLKPTVESTAKDAAQEELGATQAQAAEASKQAAAADEAAAAADKKST